MAHGFGIQWYCALALHIMKTLNKLRILYCNGLGGEWWRLTWLGWIWEGTKIYLVGFSRINHCQWCVLDSCVLLLSVIIFLDNVSYFQHCWSPCFKLGIPSLSMTCFKYSKYFSDGCLTLCRLESDMDSEEEWKCWIIPKKMLQVPKMATKEEDDLNSKMNK
jgi:hypothetical protein